MAFAALGAQLTNAIQRFQDSTVIDEEILKEFLKDVGSALLRADVNVRYVMQIRDNIKKEFTHPENKNANPRKLIQKLMVNELVSLITSSREPYKPQKNKKNIIMFVGLQGSGKTTTCTKYAYYYKRKGWKIALVCADTFRAGAFDQLKQNATKIGVPFYGSYTEPDPVKIATEGVERFKQENFDIIIVDTSGRHKQEASLFEEMRQMQAALNPDDIVFIMDSHIGQACYDQAEAFHNAVDVGSVIITKLDGHAKGGGALSAVAATDSPILFIGTGEHFDEFEPFNGESFVSRLLGLGDLKGLFSTVAEAVPLEKQPELLEHLRQGVFSLRDMRTQMETIMKMGPISQLMSMMPDFPQNMIPKDCQDQSTTRIKKFLIVLDSMTDEELDGIKPLTESRILRVSIGSGYRPKQVKRLLDEYKTFSKMLSKFGKMTFSKKGGIEKQMRNPSQLMQNMQKFMDPKVLKQLGGGQSMMNMMKQFVKMDQMPDMRDIMKNFGQEQGRATRTRIVRK